jgi:hypothetical protein
MNTENTQRTVSVPYTDDLAWLCRALSKDETRYFMNGFLAEREGDITRLIATDGRRMHIMETRKYGDIPEGLWLPQFGKGGKRERGKAPVILTEIDGTFPAWRRVIPDPRLMLPVLYIEESAPDGAAMLYPLYRAGLRINPDYIKPLSDLKERWSVYAGLENYGNGAVLFELYGLKDGESRKAVIMPMRKSDEPYRALLIEKYGAALLESVKAGYDETAELYSAVTETDEKEQADKGRTEMLAGIIGQVKAMSGEEAGEEAEPGKRGEDGGAEAGMGDEGREAGGAEARGEDGGETAAMEEYGEDAGEETAMEEYGEDGGEAAAMVSLGDNYPAYLAAAVADVLKEAA